MATLTIFLRQNPGKRARGFLISSMVMLLLLMNGYLRAQVGVHTDFPHASSAMEILSTDKGLLIPRVTLTADLANPSPVTAPATGLLVFNNGANQPMGFYYWNGSTWVATAGSGGGGTDFWSLLGNAGTNPGTNFLGTTDGQHLAIRTNNAERMRVESDGQVIVGSTTPLLPTDLFTLVANASQNYAMKVTSPYVGIYTQAARTGFQNNLGRYGFLSLVDTANGFSFYGKNAESVGYGAIFIGANGPGAILGSHTCGISSISTDGLFTLGFNSTGTGIIAVGSNADTAYFHPQGSGGSFTGYHGVFSRARNVNGTGVIGGGNNANPFALVNGSGGAFTGNGTGLISWATNAASGTGIVGVGNNGTAVTLGTGSGGSFSGYHGVIATGTNVGNGIGVIGIGSNSASFASISGSGGSFTGYHGTYGYGANPALGTGVVGLGNNLNIAPFIYPGGSGGAFTGSSAGSVAWATDAVAGTGVIGAGNALPPATLATGSGGAFYGLDGVYGKGAAAAGTGVIGVGNNAASFSTYPNGSGGAFTATEAGVVGYGTNSGYGTGVVGAGNNLAAQIYSGVGSGGAFKGNIVGSVSYGNASSNGVGVVGLGNGLAPSSTTLPAVGAGGSFSGTICGVNGYATETGGIRYGGYFSTGGSTPSYAYVGYRGNGNTNYKVFGNGTVSTIVKNSSGEPITLFCPEAPETLFQDFGTGQLVNGFAHIAIDPDLAININVSEEKPLKVFVTLEGDCNGVYVTNKSANGFDVVELMGGASNAPFSWQIVATRANEEYTLSDGSVEVSDYSRRFPPAPGPLEMAQQPVQNPQSAATRVSQSQQAPLLNADMQSLKTVSQETERAGKGSEIITVEDPDE